MENTYDVIALGGGLAGRPAAIIARRSGASVLIVEAEMLGGTCQLKGCIPKKVIISSAEIMENIRQSPGLRITVQYAHLGWDVLIDLKKAISAPGQKGREKRPEKLGIHTLSGRARFTG